MIDKSLLLHLYNRLLYGPKKRDYTDFDFRSRYEELEPVIFLSTGRCGTKWLTERLEGSRTYVPIHHPQPVMRVQAKMMYAYNFNEVDEKTFRILSEIFFAGREEIFVAAKRSGKELAITDSRGTFFAYIIASLFPKSKFIFIHRNPIGVIRSGLNRGWYSLENESELNRIVPKPGDPVFEKWEGFSATQKIAWLWQETNAWIVDFLKTIPQERQHAIRFDKWTSAKLSAMFQFMGADVSSREIEKNLTVRSNAQKSSINPKHKGWTKEDEREAIKICGEMARYLNYNI